MSHSDESEPYVSPWKEKTPRDAAKAREAADAFGALYDLYNPEGVVRTREEAIAATKQMHHAVERYSQLSIQAVAEGLEDGARPAFIQERLVTEGILSLSDPERAKSAYGIISQGYELNRPYWEGKLGEVRQFRNNLGDL